MEKLQIESCLKCSNPKVSYRTWNWGEAFSCSFQGPTCWWTPPSMPRGTGLSCCCRLWVKTTLTASSSATSCTAAMATVLGPSEHTSASTAVRLAIRCGTCPAPMANSGIRWSWLSAPSGRMSIRYKLLYLCLTCGEAAVRFLLLLISALRIID